MSEPMRPPPSDVSWLKTERLGLSYWNVAAGLGLMLAIVAALIVVVILVV